MNLQTLEYFIAVVKEKSITKASEKLFVSQPALTKQIKRLEEFLGFSVFERYSHGVTLTNKGEHFYKDIEPTINKLRFDMAKHMANQTIKMGSDPFLATYYYPDHLGYKGEMDIQLAKVTDDAMELIALMQSGEIDGAIIQDHPHHKGLFSSWLFDDVFYACVPEKFDCLNGKSISITDCLQYTQLLTPSVTPLYKRMKNLINKHVREGESPEIIEMPYHALMGFVAQGVGISYLPDIVVQKINYKGVKFLPIQDTPLKRTFYLYALSEKLHDSLKRVFE
ncbi:LysR family transcriptional regulator [Virgibacillus sp. NKC19-3]|uniref:LysR family transcriptional regulator n=1 Tax=Virgibacillus saliphilus TaxID=2831674 RepID=UPI001C9B3778|nr:LysR family transcriptional regulator [Virgibacillus sp. NKC19-3]MBY7142017.1 LysR family transcriptional regulator [Virgibacillus sp. NKC19-3]